MGNLQVVKKAGAYDENGNCIIPMEYDEIKKLKNGVYVATNRIRDEFLFGDSYHLYTEKGELKYEYEGCITEVLYDKNEEIFALEVKDISTSEWHLVEIDYEKNVININFFKSFTRLFVQFFNSSKDSRCSSIPQGLIKL